MRYNGGESTTPADPCTFVDSTSHAFPSTVSVPNAPKIPRRVVATFIPEAMRELAYLSLWSHVSLRFVPAIRALLPVRSSSQQPATDACEARLYSQVLGDRTSFRCPASAILSPFVPMRQAQVAKINFNRIKRDLKLHQNKAMVRGHADAHNCLRAGYTFRGRPTRL